MTRALDPKHECPAVGCARMIARRILACPRHWWELPEPLRHEVSQAWRDRRVDPRRHLLAVAACVRWYQDHQTERKSA